jgi:DNA-binding NarL/FixJ family response regulator
MTNRQIADHLYVTVDTVKHHVTNIMAKLDATNRTQVAAWVLKEEIRLDTAGVASGG